MSYKRFCYYRLLSRF